ncbi:MAG: hypothetical protein ACHQT8_03410, partial [Chlamydiales bacterium]
EWQREATLPRGVLVATDENLEWLLPWWWENYRAASNTYPVTFVDFGMTEQARAFCKEHGELVDFAFHPTFVKDRHELHSDVKLEWANYGETFWQARSGWFKKPLALLQSRFHLTLWLDLDCEVMQPLEPLFSLLPPHQDFAIAPEPLFYQGGSDRLFGEVLYNSGVVLFRHGAKLIQKWSTRAFHENGKFQGDQELLSRMIHEEGTEVFELPEIYNARLVTGVPLHATIIHWVGNWGKAYIRQNGGLRNAHY